jgi:histone H3/H4
MYLVTKAQIKNIIGDVNVSEEYYPALNERVTELIKKSLKRAQKNGRRTLMARDV